MTDVRFAARSLLKRPGLNLAAIATLAVGLGFNIAAASIVSSLLGRPYPYPALERLVIVRDSHPHEALHERNPIAAGDFVDLGRQARAFAAIAGWRPASLVVTGAGEPEAIVAIEATANFFDVLGVRASHGRTFVAGEDQAGRDAVVVFTRRFVNAHLGADPQVVGRDVMLNGRRATIVGIVADDQGYPAGPDAWVPMVLTAADQRERISQKISGVALMKPGTSLEEARDDVARVAGDLAGTYPETNRGRGFELVPLRREQYEFTAPLFLFVQVAALLVLCLGVTNVANLLLARTIERRHELAVRAALGASRARIFRLVTAEALAIAAVAGGIAAGLAFWIVALVRASLPDGIARWFAGWQAMHVDLATAAVAVALTVAAGVVLGAVTGARAIRAGAAPALQGGRGDIDRAGRLRRGIIAGEVCLSVVLLVGAAVALQGFRQMSAAFATLRPARLLAFSLTLPSWQYPTNARLVEFQDRVVEQLAASPEIESAALIRNPPASNVTSPVTPFAIEGQAALSASDAPRAEVQIATPDIFRTLGVAVASGRALGAGDTAERPRVAVISQTMANRYWPGRDPIGATIRVGLDAGARGVRVVGVVADLRLNWYDPQPRAVIYLPHAQSPTRQMDVLVRTKIDPADVARRVRDVVGRLDPRQPIGAVQPFTTVIDESLSPVRIISWLLTLCGILATLLAATGVYGMLAHWVASRQREIGLRLALGADPSILVRSVVGEAMLAAGVGVAAAVPLSFVAVRLAGTTSLGLPAVSPGPVAGIAVFVLAVAVAASCAPARRAARVDPVALLQSE